MKRLALISIACSACWGAGPTPNAATGVDIIFKVPPTYQNDSCTNDRYPYIGDVVFGDGFALAAEMHFSPPMMNCDGDMGPTNENNSKPVRVHRIPLDGAAATVATVGAMNSNGAVTTRVVATPSRGGSAHSVDPGSTLELRGDGVTQQTIMYNGSFYIPSGLVADETDAYMIVTTGEPRSSQEVNHPEYPCCSNTGGSGGSGPGSLGWKLAWDMSTSPQQISLPTAMYVISDTLKTGVVANRTTVFYAMRTVIASTRDVELFSMPKTDTTEFTSRAAVGEDLGIPVGLAATDERLAWTVSWSYARLPLPESRCGLYLLDLMTAGAVPQLHFNAKGAFSCQDLALDGEHAYFMITAVDASDNSDNNPGDMRGIGIGRVSLTDPMEFESVAIGDGDSLYSGPRRIFLDDKNMYLVDPFAIGRIPKSALDGKADF